MTPRLFSSAGEAGSGTRDGFETITGTSDACQYRQELTSTGDVITTVAQNPDAIGYASLASIKDTVKALSCWRYSTYRGQCKGRQLRHPAPLCTGDRRGQGPKRVRTEIL